MNLKDSKRSEWYEKKVEEAADEDGYYNYHEENKILIPSFQCRAATAVPLKGKCSCSMSWRKALLSCRNRLRITRRAVNSNNDVMRGNIVASNHIRPFRNGRPTFAHIFASVQQEFGGSAGNDQFHGLTMVFRRPSAVSHTEHYIHCPWSVCRTSRRDGQR